MTKILVLAGADSHIKWCNSVARVLGGEIVLARCVEEVSDLNDVVLRNIGIEEKHVDVSIGAGFVERLAEIQPDIVVTMLRDFLLEKFLRGFNAYRSSVPADRRPICLTGFAGITMRPHTVVVARQGVDIICANSAADAELFQKILEPWGEKASRVIDLGFDFMLDKEVARPDETPLRRLVFAPQPHWPQRRGERSYVAARLVEYARAYPSIEVVVKSRLPAGQRTIHDEEYPYSVFLRPRALAGVRNLTVVDGPMLDFLTPGTALVTLSSTAAMEALARGLRVGIIRDFAYHEGYGLPFFFQSGLLMNFDEILQNRFAPANGEWLRRNGLAGGAGRDRLFQAVDEALSAHRGRETAAEPLPVGYGMEWFGYGYRVQNYMPHERLDRFRQWFDEFIPRRQAAEALAAISEVEKSRPLRPAENFLAANAHYALGDRKKAQEFIVEAVEGEGERAVVLELAGRIFEDGGDYEKAAECLQAAWRLVAEREASGEGAKILPRSRVDHTGPITQAAVRERLDRRDYAGAFRIARLALAQTPGSFANLKMALQAAGTLGRKDEAEALAAKYSAAANDAEKRAQLAGLLKSSGWPLWSRAAALWRRVVR